MLLAETRPALEPMTLKKRFMLATLVVALCGVCLEIILRISHFAPTTSLLSVDLATYEQVPGIWEPGQDFVWARNPNLPHSVETNSLGYRGEEFDQEKKPNELRVFMAGDSYTFGTNINEKETLPHMLQQEINNSCKNKHLSLINAGIPGSTIKSHSEMIRRGMQLKPDVVVLVFNESDVNDLADPLWDHMADNRDTKGRMPLSIVWPILRKTASWRLISNLREASVSEQLNKILVKNIEEDFNNIELKNTYLHDLKNLESQVAAGGSTFVIVTYPGPQVTLGEPMDDTMEWAMQEFPKLGIPTFDLLEPLQQAFSDDIHNAYLFPDDGHPSKLGNQFAGKQIANWLLTLQPIRSRCIFKKT